MPSRFLSAGIASIIVLLAGAVIVPAALADRTVRCESEDFAYRHCDIGRHGYVRLSRQISDAPCRQGRNWDYDRRGIWVDDGCAGEFVVEERHHTKDHQDHKGEKAVAAVAGLALIAAAVAAASSDDDHHYRDEGYHRGGHSSYVPRWMVGDFGGYNTRYGAEIDLQIAADGRVQARVDGTRLQGYVNDQHLYIGDAEFTIDRAGDGFTTTQVGDRGNRVHYRRN